MSRPVAFEPGIVLAFSDLLQHACSKMYKRCARWWLKLVPLVLFVPWLAGCTAGGNVNKPIPSAFYPAPQQARLTVVMLPGIDDSLEDLENRHLAALIQKVRPHANVVLTGLTLPFYKQGRAAQRLHDEVIARYRKNGQPIWIAGISLGGLGVLLYDRRYPGDAAALLLMSPYLGGDAIRKKIQAAGGLARWDPGPKQAINADNFRHELWRYLKSWRHRPQRTRTVWLAYGTHDRFRKSIAMVTPMLPPGHVIELPGGHNWNLWNRAFPAILKRTAKAQSY